MGVDFHKLTERKTEISHTRIKISEAKFSYTSTVSHVEGMPELTKYFYVFDDGVNKSKGKRHAETNQIESDLQSKHLKALCRGPGDVTIKFENPDFEKSRN